MTYNIHVLPGCLIIIVSIYLFVLSRPYIIRLIVHIHFYTFNSQIFLILQVLIKIQNSFKELKWFSFWYQLLSTILLFFALNLQHIPSKFIFV